MNTYLAEVQDLTRLAYAIGIILLIACAVTWVILKLTVLEECE